MSTNTSNTDRVVYTKAEKVATITLNRPEKLNTLDENLYSEFDAALSQAERDPTVRAIVITGAGRCFSAGSYIKQPRSKGVFEEWEKRDSVSERQFRLWQIPKPIVAAVHGYCLGRGLELALWCDIVIAAEDAQFGQPEVRSGSFVATIVPWIMDPQHAKLFMLSGDLIGAREAERLGLVARVVPTGDAQAAAFMLAQRLAHVPPVTVRSIKRWISMIYEERGIRPMQELGTRVSSLLKFLTPKESDTETLAKIRSEKGLKAFLQARDQPFKTEGNG
jgi:enoyl-CoA hydratase